MKAWIDKWMGRGTDRQTVRLEDGQSDELGIDRMRDGQGGVMDGGMERVTDCGIDRGMDEGVDWRWTVDRWRDRQTDGQSGGMGNGQRDGQSSR